MTTSVSYEVETKDVFKLLSRLEMSISPPALRYMLEEGVYPWMVEETVQRFAYAGDWRSGNWPDLEESTQRIREDAGYEGDWPINIRTERLFDYVTTSKQVTAEMGGASLVVPGPTPDPTTGRKYLTAQMGSDINPMFPGAITPPRPVVAWGEEADAEQVLMILSTEIVITLQGGGF